MSLSNRKRTRHRKACLACRRRKSKCDCKRPVCDTCQRRQTDHLCIYDDLYPFQRSLRHYPSEAVNPNFPSFDTIHLPQMIAVGDSLSQARAYRQELYLFGKIKPPRFTRLSSAVNDSAKQNRSANESLNKETEQNKERLKEVTIEENASSQSSENEAKIDVRPLDEQEKGAKSAKPK